MSRMRPSLRLALRKVVIVFVMAATVAVPLQFAAQRTPVHAYRSCNFCTGIGLSLCSNTLIVYLCSGLK